MSRSSRLLLATVFTALGASSAFAYDGGLVRIEPRPYYGAVVTVEQGVRVYRPLPAQNLMIINPNRTPISLSFSRSIEHKAADGGSGGGVANGDGGGDVRYGGIGGFGNGIAGTNPKFDKRDEAAGLGLGGRRGHKTHVRKHTHH